MIRIRARAIRASTMLFTVGAGYLDIQAALADTSTPRNSALSPVATYSDSLVGTLLGVLGLNNATSKLRLNHGMRTTFPFWIAVDLGNSIHLGDAGDWK